MNRGITNVMGKSNNDTNSRRASKLCGRKCSGSQDKLLMSARLWHPLDTMVLGYVHEWYGADRNHEADQVNQ